MADAHMVASLGWPPHAKATEQGAGRWGMSMRCQSPLAWQGWRTGACQGFLGGGPAAPGGEVLAWGRPKSLGTGCPEKPDLEELLCWRHHGKVQGRTGQEEEAGHAAGMGLRPGATSCPGFQGFSWC